MEMVNDYKWHCDYPQLAWDSGFSFGKYQYSNIDKYKICLVDIERIIRERDVASVENQIPTILQYNLDNEQANVLDQNFVKIFRISQLSVEYLLFCKKYLDGLVITMKKQIDDLTQEKKEMKSYVEELESHLSSNNLTSTFKCDKCPKVFSSENYLTAHFKRRHDEENIMKKSSENEQLHSELRELKDRLNIAEKKMKNEPESEKLKIEESSSKYIDEIQKSFGMFKDQVENKIEHLKTEREFLNEKYDKMFDALLQFKNKGEGNVKEEKNTKESPVEIQTTEHTTQTENYNKTSNLEIQTITNIDTSQTKETNVEITAIKGADEIDNLVEQKIHAFGDNIENKISDGLLNIQNQMKQLCEKLLQLEANQSNSRKFGEMVNIQTSTINKKYSEECKPMIKPRTKLSKPTTLVKTASNCNEAENLKTELNKMLSTKTVESQLELTSECESEMDSIIIQKKKPKVQKVQPKLTKVSKNENGKNNSNVASSQVERKIEEVKCEINDALLVKLQEMGISPHWKSIPKKSFEKALDIIKHQASQNKKDFPDYEKLKTFIEHSMRLGDELKSVKPKQDSEKPSLIRIGYRKKHNHKALKEGPESEPAIKPVVSIKNRSLYDTDSEIEQLENNLKVMNTENTDSDLKSLDLSDEDRKIETKSALKTYPSDGSLVKKKVLFSMEKFDTSVDGKTVENSETSLSNLQIS